MIFGSRPAPRKIVNERLHSYPAAMADIPARASVKQVFVKAAARLNNRADNNHRPTRERKRRMRGLRDTYAPGFLTNFGPMRQHLALNRHLLRASQYRKHLAARFASRRDITEPARSLSIPT